MQSDLWGGLWGVTIPILPRRTGCASHEPRVGDLDPRDWELPLKPKWMHWHSHERLAGKYRFQQRKIDGIIANYVG